MAIEIINFTENKVEEPWVKKIVSFVLQAEKQNENATISIAFLGPGRMRKLNKQYRGKNTTTDVLSFVEKEVAFEKYKIGKLKEQGGLGEIVVCLREVKKNSKRNKTDFEKELAFVLIHGLLHLLGYEHEKTDTKAKEMQAKEMSYLKQI